MELKWKYSNKVKYQGTSKWKSKVPRKFRKSNKISRRKVPGKTRKTNRISKKEVPRKQKKCGNVENYLLQVKQSRYHNNIWTIYHRSLYQRIVKLFKHEKHHILIADLYHTVKSVDEKLHICETCNNHL